MSEEEKIDLESHPELEESKSDLVAGEYKDLVISELKKEIFELRKSQIQIDKMSSSLKELEKKCAEYEGIRVCLLLT